MDNGIIYFAWARCLFSTQYVFVTLPDEDGVSSKIGK